MQLAVSQQRRKKKTKVDALESLTVTEDTPTEWKTEIVGVQDEHKSTLMIVKNNKKKKKNLHVYTPHRMGRGSWQHEIASFSLNTPLLLSPRNEKCVASFSFSSLDDAIM